MRTLAKLGFAALLSAGAALAVAQPAEARTSFGISIGVGGPYGYYDPGRPCWYYREYDLPAPNRCYQDYYGYYGPGVFIDSGFVFRSHDTYYRWRDRDDWRHWRAHDYRWRDRYRDRY